MLAILLGRKVVCVMQNAECREFSVPRTDKRSNPMVRAAFAAALFAGIVSGSTSIWAAEQREFPTGEPGVNVTYSDSAGPGYSTSCVVAITFSLPTMGTMGLSFTFHSDNRYDILIGAQRPFGNIQVGAAATVKINSVYLFAKVTRTWSQGSFHLVNLEPLDNTSLQNAYVALNHIVHNPARVDVVVDSAQLPSISLSPKPGLGDALTACQSYMISR